MKVKDKIRLGNRLIIIMQSELHNYIDGQASGQELGSACHACIE